MSKVETPTECSGCTDRDNLLYEYRYIDDKLTENEQSIHNQRQYIQRLHKALGLSIFVGEHEAMEKIELLRKAEKS